MRKKSVAVIALIILVLLAAWLALRGPDIPYAALEAKYAGPESHFVDLPGDVRVHYRDEGAAQAPLLVLVHGFGDSFTSWEGWAKVLKDRFRVISIDLPGHGLTRAPENFVSTGANYADLIDAFAARAELPKFAIAGNSMGGAVAWQFALKHPERVYALILVDAAGWPPQGPPKELPLAFKILRYRLGRAFLRNIDNTPLIDQGLKMDVYDKSVITPAFVARWAELQRAPGHRRILMSLDPASLGTASRELLAAIKVPALIVHGENDILIDPAAARKFAAAIPSSTLILYPRVGHLPQVEIPDRSAADVAKFLGGIALAQPP